MKPTTFWKIMLFVPFGIIPFSWHIEIGMHLAGFGYILFLIFILIVTRDYSWNKLKYWILLSPIIAGGFQVFSVLFNTFYAKNNANYSINTSIEFFGTLFLLVLMYGAVFLAIFYILFILLRYLGWIKLNA